MPSKVLTGQIQPRGSKPPHPPSLLPPFSVLFLSTQAKPQELCYPGFLTMKDPDIFLLIYLFLRACLVPKTLSSALYHP